MKLCKTFFILFSIFCHVSLISAENRNVSVSEFSFLIYRMYYENNAISKTPELNEILKLLPKNLSDKLSCLPPSAKVTKKVLLNTMSLYLSSSLISDILKEGSEEEVMNMEQIQNIIKQADFKQKETDNVLTYRPPQEHNFTDRLENTADEVPEKLLSGE